MPHIIFGLLAIVFGVWALSRNWFAFLDFIYVLGPVLFLFVGVIMLLAGISGLKTEAKVKE